MLQFVPERLVKLDLKPFGIGVSSVYMYLDYFNHNYISGNKLRKLYRNILEAKKNNFETIITIGGNYSNHLYAAAHIPEFYGLHVVAIVKGHEPKKYGYTLETLRRKNIPMFFVDFNTLKTDFDSVLTSLKESYPNAIYIPEGGTNEWSKYGYEPLIQHHFDEIDILCVPVGTGGTMAAINKYKKDRTKLRGYCALNDYSLREHYPLLDLEFKYTFGGYAKTNAPLIDFILKFKETNNIPLEPVYTGKMMYGIIEDLKKGVLNPAEKIVAFHTGGLQGLHGFENLNEIQK